MNDSPVLKTPGEMITEAREAQDLTIAQLSERTKIPPPVLSALELDEYHKISGPLYIKSFLRTCAVDLGLEAGVVLALYNKISGEQRKGSPGQETVWGEEDVKVSRIGLPWLRIILFAGIGAVVIGLGLFTLRGCGDETSDGEATAEVQRLSPEETAAAGVGADSASGPDSRPESLMPPAMEAELLEKAAAGAPPEAAPAEDEPGDPQVRLETGPGLPASYDPGWMLKNPPPVVEEEDPEDEVGADQAGEDQAGEDQAADQIAAAETVTRDDSPAGTNDGTPEMTPVELPVTTPVESTTDPVGESEDRTAAVETETPVPTPSTEVEISPSRTEDSPVEEPVIISPGTGSGAESEEAPGDWVDSAWPLVLRVICDSPQRIQVKRDGDRTFSEVRWPTASETAPEVPAAGFEAGRAYRLDGRLVVFWGADDHFSLILARKGGVEVAVNGRVRDIARLRPGQELILDARSAGSGAE